MPIEFDADGNRETVLNAARRFFLDNPGEVLYREDIRLKFDCGIEMAKRVARALLREGIVESWQIPRPPCKSRTRKAQEKAELPFPDCLTKAQRQALEAYVAAGSIVGAARATGRNHDTLADHLKDARKKAGVHTSSALALLFTRSAA